MPPIPADSFSCRYEKLFGIVCTAISREVVGKNVHATIPKGNIGSGLEIKKNVWSQICD